MENREVALQLRVEHLEEIIVMMDREIRRLRGGPGGAPGDAWTFTYIILAFTIILVPRCGT